MFYEKLNSCRISYVLAYFNSKQNEKLDYKWRIAAFQSLRLVEPSWVYYLFKSLSKSNINSPRKFKEFWAGGVFLVQAAPSHFASLPLCGPLLNEFLTIFELNVKFLFTLINLRYKWGQQILVRNMCSLSLKNILFHTAVDIEVMKIWEKIELKKLELSFIFHFVRIKTFSICCLRLRIEW